VLQQSSQAGSAAGQTHQQLTQVTQIQGGQQQIPARLVLGQLPGGKLVIQGSQLAALTQARAAGQAGGQPKVLTIQLQVQQQPNQQGGIKVRNQRAIVFSPPVPVLFSILSLSGVLPCDRVECRLHASCSFPIDAFGRVCGRS